MNATSFLYRSRGGIATWQAEFSHGDLGVAVLEFERGVHVVSALPPIQMSAGGGQRTVLDLLVTELVERNIIAAGFEARGEYTIFPATGGVQEVLGGIAEHPSFSQAIEAWRHACMAWPGVPLRYNTLGGRPGRWEPVVREEDGLRVSTSVETITIPGKEEPRAVITVRGVLPPAPVAGMTGTPAWWEPRVVVPVSWVPGELVIPGYDRREINLPPVGDLED